MFLTFFFRKGSPKKVPKMGFFGFFGRFWDANFFPPSALPRTKLGPLDRPSFSHLPFHRTLGSSSLEPGQTSGARSLPPDGHPDAPAPQRPTSHATHHDADAAARREAPAVHAARPGGHPDVRQARAGRRPGRCPPSTFGHWQSGRGSSPLLVFVLSFGRPGKGRLGGSAGPPPPQVPAYLVGTARGVVLANFDFFRGKVPKKI